MQNIDFVIEDDLKVSTTTQNLDDIRLKNYLNKTKGELYYLPEFGKPSMLSIKQDFINLGAPEDVDTQNQHYINLINEDLSAMNIQVVVTKIEGDQFTIVNNVAVVKG